MKNRRRERTNKNRKNTKKIKDRAGQKKKKAQHRLATIFRKHQACFSKNVHDLCVQIAAAKKLCEKCPSNH